MSKHNMKWAYGVTTVPERANELLPQTLRSLQAGGFPNPRLFIDGERYSDIPLAKTFRTPGIRTFGNWILGLAELYIREPIADRYAMFQDDMVCYRNLREYLNQCPYHEQGYWNLYTFPQNQYLAPVGTDGKQRVGWYPSNQRGRGAVALVFSRLAVVTLLTHLDIVMKPQDAHRGWRNVDGAISNAFQRAKPRWLEYVHNPSLVQHTGAFTTMGNKPHKQAESFRGEAFDALTLLQPTQPG